MTYNIIAYCIYIPIIFFIMIKIGWMFYTHGEIFLQNIFHQNKPFIKSINNLLLVGYYLVNLGYAIVTIAYWEKINSVAEILNTLSQNLGIIIIGLSILNYNNIFCLIYLTKSKTLKQ